MESHRADFSSVFGRFENWTRRVDDDFRDTAIVVPGGELSSRRIRF